ncbi:acyl-CoA dehydratase activase [Mahella sp.]|uniref:acyl-CoA dehydratase activase n=1 Tax=Mahella sp. TaxID=2798721 RepID=UPI0025BFE5E0|nr:acyl-CoA dehydratase activase [Mahella sp.]
MDYYLGIDIGSVSSDFVLIDDEHNVISKLYLKTQGQPIKAIKDGLRLLRDEMPEEADITGVGSTGSGRDLAGVMVGADIVKNEITAHAVATLEKVSDVSTILEIGGQDSKIIIIRDGIVTDFAMNTVCAAGTGSFLDRQAARLDVPIEQFGEMALRSTTKVRIAGRCAVFAESDMIHKQQMGYEPEDIINGLCEALVRNYLNNVGKGKEILPKVVFQGGVAANVGIKHAFEEALKCDVYVPEHHEVMGAIGAAILAQEEAERKGYTDFRGFDLVDMDFKTKSFDCDGCANQCEVVQIMADKQVVARWGDRCGKWHNALLKRQRRDKDKAMA